MSSAVREQVHVVPIREVALAKLGVVVLPLGSSPGDRVPPRLSRPDAARGSPRLPPRAPGRGSAARPHAALRPGSFWKPPASPCSRVLSAWVASPSSRHRAGPMISSSSQGYAAFSHPVVRDFRQYLGEAPVDREPGAAKTRLPFDSLAEFQGLRPLLQKVE
jgi:hypothetical protein